MAKKGAISLHSFAKGCIMCSGIIFFFAPASVNSPALCAGAVVAQKRQKNAEGLGRRSAFFMGRAADRRGGGQRSGSGQRRADQKQKASKRHVQNGKTGQKVAENIKRRDYPAFFVAIWPYFDAF